MSENDGMSQTQYARYTQSNIPNDTVFHAVYVPPENGALLVENRTNDNLRVYLNKAEALKVIKEYKTGRLKTFKSRIDAEKYARTGYEEANSCHYNSTQGPQQVIVEEKSSNFKGPRTQELVCFRKLIESGDLEAVKVTVWGNPRYLISSGDTPAILQEGCRYNALHIAVKAGKADMCQLILNTVGSTEFMQLLYGEEECKSYLDRAQVMLDLYLNTPDKGLNETPLHFAVKFGLKDVVRVLVSYSECIKTLPNKYKQMPVDIICSRKCQDDEELKKEIRMLLEDQYYVPVLRSEDNTLQPVIGELFSPTNPLKLNEDPISPPVKVRAFAGPMTKPQALEFRKKWKTPPRLRKTFPSNNVPDNTNSVNNPSVNLALRLQDTEKGLERVGRDLAEEYHVPWKEYWPFLNDFVNFHSTEGLTKLERYLEQKLRHCSFNSTKSKLEIEIGVRNLDITSEPEKVDEIKDLCDRLQSCTLDASFSPQRSSTDEEFFTPPSSPVLNRNCCVSHDANDSDNSSDDDMFVAEEGSAMFIEGTLPTKTDYAVYNAIPSTIDLNLYPNIYKWHHEVQLAIKRNLLTQHSSGTARRKLLISA